MFSLKQMQEEETLYRRVYVWGCKQVSRSVITDEVDWFINHTRGFFLTRQEAVDFMWNELDGGACWWIPTEYPAIQEIGTDTFTVYLGDSRTITVVPYESAKRKEVLEQWRAARAKLTDAEYRTLTDPQNSGLKV